MTASLMVFLNKNEILLMMKYKQNNNEVTTMEIDLPEESGRSKRKRVL